MSTTETPDDMTAEDHIRAARRYAAAAEDLAGATSYEWISRRTNDLQAAQVHATLAQTLKAAEVVPLMARLAAYLEGPEPPAQETAGSGEPSP